MSCFYTEPTGDQCNNKEMVPAREGHTAFACWYPQMGGYVGKAIVEFINNPGDDPDEKIVNYCFDAYIWHDGEFPFQACDGEPSEIHHCCPSQFVLFGETVLERQKNREQSK